MSSFVATVLQLALSLLLAVQNNPSLPAAQQQQAIATAMQAIQLVAQVAQPGSGLLHTPTTPLAAAGSPVIASSTTQLPAINSPAVSSSITNQAIGSPVAPASGSSRVSATAMGVSVNRVKAANDDIGSLTFPASAAGAIALNKIVVTFGGTAPSSTTFLSADNIILFDPSMGLPAAGYAPSFSAPCNGSNTCTATFAFGAGPAGFQISAGTAKTFTVRIGDENSTLLAGSGGVTESLSASIQNVGDITFTDGLDSSAATNVSVPATNPLPLTINSVGFTQGQ